MDNPPEDPKLTELKRVIDSLWPDHRDAPTDIVSALLAVINEHQHDGGRSLPINECDADVRPDLGDEASLGGRCLNNCWWYCAKCTYQCDWCKERYMVEHEHDPRCAKRPHK